MEQSTKNKSILVGVIVLVVLLFGALYFNNSNDLVPDKNIGVEVSAPETQEILIDFTKAAIESRNPVLCEKIQLESSKIYCKNVALSSKASFEKDASICGEISDEFLASTCADAVFFATATEAKDAELCNKITNKDRLVACKEAVK